MDAAEFANEEEAALLDISDESIVAHSAFTPLGALSVNELQHDDRDLPP